MQNSEFDILVGKTIISIEMDDYSTVINISEGNKVVSYSKIEFYINPCDGKIHREISSVIISSLRLHIKSSSIIINVDIDQDRIESIVSTLNGRIVVI